MNGTTSPDSRSAPPRTVVLVHGYGVRSSFWEKLQPQLEQAGFRVVAPDLAGDSPVDLAEQVAHIARDASTDGPVALVGHSLGGILCAMAALRAPAELVSHLVVIASPYAGRAKSVGPIIKFLIRFRLLPPALIRPRFFSSATSRADQKRWFARAVPESAALQQVLFGTDWFPVGELSRPSRRPALAISSDADRIVDAEATGALAAALGAVEHRFPRERAVGHNDFAASDTVSAEVSRVIAAFLSSPPARPAVTDAEGARDATA